MDISSNKRVAGNIPKKHGERRVKEESREDPIRQTMNPKDFEAFIEQAVTEHESALIGYARTFVYDRDRARDVVQDTFIRLCKQDVEKVRDHLKSWLFTVCRNRCLDVLRKDKRIEPLDDLQWKKVAGTEVAPDEAAEQEDKMEGLMRMMDRLPKNQRDVILLKFQQGLSYKEIAEVTGLGQGNIGFLIHTGLKRLRELMPSGRNN
ncbi:MAG: RNA polymerase sigma factor [Luteolibacter sp.]